MKTYAVIGKNFGDEGKGLVSASLCLHAKKPLVIKHNGGAQAGHTVEWTTEDRIKEKTTEPSGEIKDFRFIHHQIGSGAEFGASTLLADTYYADLYQIGNEVEQFKEVYGFAPSMFAQKDTCITVIYDVLLNMELEKSRGDDRHGSCGMGINECRERINAGYALTVGEVASHDEKWIIDRLKEIRDNYILAQAGRYGLDSGALDELFYDDNVPVNYAEEIKKNLSLIRIVEADREWLENYDALIFENGQGLLLDEYYLQYAPHLTTSRTGIINPAVFLEKRNLDLNEVIYVTRSYVTRHGAGPLPCECKREDIHGVEYDITNEPNEWQGTIRYARHVDFDGFWEAIDSDIAEAAQYGSIKDSRVSVAITHLNETGGAVCFDNDMMDIDSFKKQCAKIALAESRKSIYRIYESYKKQPMDAQLFD